MKTHFCEICAKTAEWRPEGHSRFCLQGIQNNKTETTPTSSPISLPVLKHGCMVMTPRLSSSRRSGSRQIHRGRKKCVKFAAMSSPCWSFFSTSKALSTRNLYPLVKLPMACFTVRFWSGWGRAFDANVQTSGRKTIGFSNVTTRPLTHHSLFDNSWLPKALQWFPTPLFAWPRPLQLFPFAQDEVTVERASFDMTEEIHAESQEIIDSLTFENF
jgi:hypothetical protein